MAHAVGAADAADSALAELERARKLLARSSARQVSSADEVDALKSLAFSWFRAHKPSIVSGDIDVAAVDVEYQTILTATARRSARSTYAEALKRAKRSLAHVRTLCVGVAPEQPAADPAPAFSRLVTDPMMVTVLVRRWAECKRCLDAEAYLAATVMMGGLLEALFVARANLMADKKPLFTAKSAPLDKKTKSPLPLNQWTLRPYVDVAHELGWITAPAKDAAAVLRDYRNYVHPEKEFTHGVVLGSHDAEMSWGLTKSLIQQLLS